MTNLARLIQKNPAAFAAIDELVSMGGAFKSHGNCSPVAEYNYWADPDAAALVYETAAMQNRLIHMVGLDVTRQIVLTPDLISYLKRLDSKTGSFVEAITKFYLDFHWEWEHMIGCVINDPLAVAYFADHSLCSGFDAYTAVETGGISIGQTVVDSMNFYKNESNSVVLTQTDPVRFFTFFFSRLLNKTPDELDLLPFFYCRYLGVLLGMFFTVSVFYTYSGILGRNFLILDILLFYSSVIFSFGMSEYISGKTRSPHETEPGFVVSLWLITSFFFFVFTCFPPDLPLFYSA